jgi:hypothetical protein
MIPREQNSTTLEAINAGDINSNEPTENNHDRDDTAVRL